MDQSPGARQRHGSDRCGALALSVAGALAAGLALGSCAESHAEGQEQPAAHGPELEAAQGPELVAPDSTQSGAFEVPPPPFSEGVFPCSDCHAPEIPTNRKRRTLKWDHEEIVLRHDEDNRWCLDCHEAGDRDQLHLASGELIGFEESYRLCGQCHGDKYRSWRNGIHGRRTGRWDGHKSYLLCVHCHDSHDPAFKPIRPLPPPPQAREDPMSDCRGFTRRDFMCIATGCAAATASACVDPTHTEFFRRHLTELSREDIERLLAQLERDYREKFGRDVEVGMDEPRPGVEFGYALDLSRCVGCRRCVYACVDENNQSREPALHWIRVLEMDSDKGIDFAHADPYYEAEEVPRPGHFYVPVACQQCRNAPCVKSCPVAATWQDDDGIVVIDYDWCIGCRCCISSCPYGARHFNWSEPQVPPEELNPETHLLGNRPRPRGVVEKCTFCIHRTREGRYPACVEACPAGARKFGNLRDPGSEVRYVLEHERVFVLKNELNTRPRFYYFYST